MHGIGICLVIICIGFNLILSCTQSNPKMSLSLKHLTIKEVLADLLCDHTHTVRGCFHLGVCVLLHLSVLFDCPSTATSTYGLGPNQFLLFSLSFAERTTRKKNTAVKLLITYILKQPLLCLTFLKMYTCDLQLGLHGLSITVQALLPHQ